MNTDKIFAEAIANEYAPKDTSKVVALRKLDRKAKGPANIFAYSFGVLMTPVFGLGMCLSMQVIGGDGVLMTGAGILLGILGIVGVGLFTFGVLAMGMLSLGIVAGGLAAFGVAALGYLALGVSAVGVYAGGVAAIAAKIAVAVSSVAPTAVGEFASGSHVLLWGDGLTAPEVQTFLLEHHPDLWRPLLRLLTEIGAHIK